MTSGPEVLGVEPRTVDRRLLLVSLPSACWSSPWCWAVWPSSTGPRRRVVARPPLAERVRDRAGPARTSGRSPGSWNPTSGPRSSGCSAPRSRPGSPTSPCPSAVGGGTPPSRSRSALDGLDLDLTGRDARRWSPAPGTSPSSASATSPSGCAATPSGPTGCCGTWFAYRHVTEPQDLTYRVDDAARASASGRGSSPCERSRPLVPQRARHAARPGRRRRAASPTSRPSTPHLVADAAGRGRGDGAGAARRTRPPRRPALAGQHPRRLRFRRRPALGRRARDRSVSTGRPPRSPP